MALLLAFPVLLLAFMLQIAIVSNLPLLGGTADLILIVLTAWAIQERTRSLWLWTLVGGGMVGLVSALPGVSALIGYVLAVALVRLLTRRIWQVPILTLFTGIVLGTLAQHLFSVAILFVNGQPLPFQESMTWVTLPSILLNLILALPVYGLVSDLARLVNPKEVAA